MKKVLTISAALVSLGAFAQTTTNSVNTNTNPNDTLLVVVTENQTGALATLGGEDTDGNDVLTLALSGTDASLFAVTPASGSVAVGGTDIGDLTSTATFNVDVKSQYNFSVSATDAGGLTTGAIPVVVKVQAASIDSLTSQVHVAENTTGGASWPLTAYLSNGNTTQGGQWVLNNPPSGFTLTQNNVLTMNASVVLDHETTPYYDVNVTMSRGQATITQDVRVFVDNVNETPFRIYVK